MTRSTRIAVGVLLVAAGGIVVFGAIQLVEVRGQVNTMRQELEDARGDQTLESRVTAVESLLDNLSTRQDQIVTGLEGIRAQFRQVVGTETGILPVGFSSLVDLGRRASSTELRLNVVEADVANLESCARDLETAIETGFPVVGCFFF